LAANQLLSEYLQVYPHGALSEEARALSIEAAEEAEIRMRRRSLRAIWKNIPTVDSVE